MAGQEKVLTAALVRDAVAAQARHADLQEFCPGCRSLTSFPHVHKEDESGLDDGPELSKSQQVAARRVNARKLADAGLTHDLISKVIGVSRPTITADLSKER